MVSMKFCEVSSFMSVPNLLNRIGSETEEALSSRLLNSMNFSVCSGSVIPEPCFSYIFIIL